MLSEPTTYGGERKKSYVANVYGGDRKQSYVGGDRKQSYVGGDRKPSYVGNVDGQVPIVIVGQDRKRSCIGYADGQIRVPTLGSPDRKQSYIGSDRKPSYAESDDRKPSYTGSTDGQMLPAVGSDMQQELDSIRQDCQFFGETLSSVKPGKELPSDKELLRVSIVVKITSFPRYF